MNLRYIEFKSMRVKQGKLSNPCRYSNLGVSFNSSPGSGTSRRVRVPLTGSILAYRD